MELWKVLIFITLFYVTFVSAANQNVVESVKPSENISLKEFMTRSASIMLENPSTASSCSDYYLELIDCIFTEFEENNKACREKAISDRAAIDELTKDNQDALAERTDSAYAKVSQCRGEDSAQSVFQCYVDEGSSSSKDMRSISNDATLQSLELKEALRRIDSERDFCLMDNKFKYEQDSADAYEEFTNCILGSVPVPRGSVDCKCLY